MKYPLPAPVKSPGAEIYYTQVPEYSKFNIIPVVQPKPTRPKNLVFFEGFDGFGVDSVEEEKKSKFNKYLLIFLCVICIFVVLPLLFRKMRK